MEVKTLEDANQFYLYLVHKLEKMRKEIDAQLELPGLDANINFPPLAYTRSTLSLVHQELVLAKESLPDTGHIKAIDRLASEFFKATK